jgi:hypothetical protein
MIESGSTSPPSNGLLQRALRPRYSDVDAVLFVLLVAAAAFRSPLPKVTLVSPGPLLPDDRAYRHDYEFTQDWFTYNIPVWDSALAPYKGKPGVNYLEVGVVRRALGPLDVGKHPDRPDEPPHRHRHLRRRAEAAILR